MGADAWTQTGPHSRLSAGNRGDLRDGRRGVHGCDDYPRFAYDTRVPFAVHVTARYTQGSATIRVLSFAVDASVRATVYVVSPLKGRLHPGIVFMPGLISHASTSFRRRSMTQGGAPPASHSMTLETATRHSRLTMYRGSFYE